MFTLWKCQYQHVPTVVETTPQPFVTSSYELAIQIGSDWCHHENFKKPLFFAYNQRGTDSIWWAHGDECLQAGSVLSGPLDRMSFARFFLKCLDFFLEVFVQKYSVIKSDRWSSFLNFGQLGWPSGSVVPGFGSVWIDTFWIAKDFPQLPFHHSSPFHALPRGMATKSWRCLGVTGCLNRDEKNCNDYSISFCSSSNRQLLWTHYITTYLNSS